MSKLNLILAITLATLGLIAINSMSSLPQTVYEVQQSVMVVSNSKTSGGSGVVISSTQETSTVLTNGHVCNLLANGGLVISADLSEHRVANYRKSEQYDLCLIEVQENLHINTAIAPTSPIVGERATVVGHPLLLPTMVTEGYFSYKLTIMVEVGSHPCTDFDKHTARGVWICASNGGMMPDVKAFESIMTSALIEPGSSGSPVFNSRGELAALIFAGDRNSPYSYAVPLEAIQFFLFSEVKLLSKTVPENMLDASSIITNQNIDNQIKRIFK